MNGLFLDINEGNKHKNIYGYNGGLFSENLENLRIMDLIEDPLFFKDIYQNWKFEGYDIDIQSLVMPYGDSLNPIYQNLLRISQFDFTSDLDVNILGHIFENSIGDIEELKKETQGRRKKDGIYYTPEYITDYICRNTILPYLSKTGEVNTVDGLVGEFYGSEIEELDQKVKEIKIVDPACGSGAFLNKAADVLLEIHQAIHKKKYKDKQDLSPFFDNINQRREILLNNIYGVDLNEESVEITKLSLFLKVCRKDLKLPNLNNNIKNGNSLIDDPNFTDKPFNWNKEFPRIFDKGGFDIVVGNPPYFNIQTLGKNSHEVEYLKNNYSQIWMDKSDILFYFIAKSIEISRKYVSLIISNAFLYADKGQKLRNFILNNAPMSAIINFENYLVFSDASITTAIVILDKNKTNTITNAISLKNKNYGKNELLKIINEPTNFFKAELSKDHPFALINDEIDNINRKIDGNYPKLKELFFVGKGMETAANKIYSFNSFPSNFNKKFIKMRMKGEIIKRYAIDTGKEYLLYVEDIENFEDLPIEIQEYLLENKERLEDRADKKRRKTSKWWSYSFPLHKEYYNLNKIWCSYRSKTNCFALDETEKYIGLTNTTVIFDTNTIISLKYLLTLLNSKLLTFRYKTIGKQTGSGVYEYFENQISKLAIPEISEKNQKPFIEKADTMLQFNKDLMDEINGFKDWLQRTFYIDKFSKKLDKYYDLSFDEFLVELKKKKIDTKHRKTQELLKSEFEGSVEKIKPLQGKIEVTDKKIDNMVYSLYGLTDDEIQIIEDSFK